MNNLNPLYNSSETSKVDNNYALKYVIRTIINNTNTLEEAKQICNRKINEIKSRSTLKKIWYVDSIDDYETILEILNNCTQQNYKQMLMIFLKRLEY